MADSATFAPAAGWRTSKACQECRKRKIKCNGTTPCSTCHERNTPCTYRDFVRRRKRKLESRQESQERGPGHPRPLSPAPEHPQSSRKPPGNYTFNHSVSATHMTSQSNKIQLYYGSTSHFALMHEVYRDLVSYPPGQPEKPDEVEEAGAGIDMFSFRRIFFGTPVDPQDAGKDTNAIDVPVMFMPYELARLFLQRFLSSLYFIVPFQPQETIERQLETLYHPSPDSRLDIWSRSLLLMAMAMGCLGTEHYGWGDVLFERVKASCALLDDVVNLQTVQLSLFMAHYQMEQGRPNSSFLHLGAASRKAISAGLHKEAPNERNEGRDGGTERGVTFWCLYFYEVWSGFHLGRPRSLSPKDVDIAVPPDPFVQVLAELSKVIARSADEMYGQHHDSLLQMWRLARSITDDLRCFDAKMRHALGFGLDKSAQPGGMGVKQAMLITLYYHTILLTYRPFLIFRSRWQQDLKTSSTEAEGNGMKCSTQVPTWLNEACNHALSAACRTIHFLLEASMANDHVRELRYEGYFLGSASFSLIYDLMHDDTRCGTHLPWIHAALQCLSAMRPGDPITCTISAIQTVMKRLHPSFPWSLYGTVKGGGHGSDRPPNGSNPAGNVNEPLTAPPSFPMDTTVGGQFPILSDFQGYSLQGDIHPASASVGSGEELLDFTPSEMGFDLDFSTMDLEAFFSVYPNIEPPPPAF